MTEDERLECCRKYFEDGCKCIAEGIILKVGPHVSDRLAVEIYEASCICSRNYIEEDKK